MNKNHFSPYKKEKNTQSSHWERIGQSRRQKIQEIKMRSKNDKIKDGLSTAGNVALSLANYGASIGGIIVGAVTCTAPPILSVVGIATGPIGAIVLASFGLVKMLHSAYSNVEKNHIALAPYVYSIIDAQAPTAIDETAGAAAMYLREEGEEQSNLAYESFIQASTKFDLWIQQYGQIKSKSGLKAHWENGKKQGGAVFEFMRRALHWGNYVQANSICCLLMESKNGAPIKSLDDFNNENIDEIRKKLASVEEFFANNGIDVDFASFRDQTIIKVGFGRKLKSRARIKKDTLKKSFTSGSTKDLAQNQELVAGQYNAALGHMGTGFSIAGLVKGLQNSKIGDVASTISDGVGYVGFGLGALLDGVALAKGLYSNRDGAHEKLENYVWSFVDDEPPTVKVLDKKAIAAAAYLIKEGKTQIEIGASKLDEKQMAFDNWWSKYQEMTKDYGKTLPANEAWDIEEKRMKHIKDGFKKGGVVNQYVRRLQHWGNYIQAHKITAITLKGENALADPFKGYDYRQNLRDISAKLNEHDQIFINYTKSYNAIIEEEKRKQAAKARMANNKPSAGSHRNPSFGHGSHAGNNNQRGQNRNQRPGMGSKTFKPPGHH